MDNPIDQVASVTWRARILPAVLLLLLVLLIISGYWGYQYSRIFLEQAMCYTMIKEFKEVEAQALAGSPCAAQEYVEYLRNCYPPGTKLATNSRHSQIVEIVRAYALEAIERHGALCTDK